MFFQGRDKWLTQFAMGLSRKHLHIITGLLTGYVALKRHLTVMKVCTDPLCPKCGEEEETAYHFLGKCSAMMLARYSILGPYLMDIMELHKFNHTLFWGLQKPRRELYNLSVISGLRIGLKLTTASALDSMLSSLKVKVKVKVRYCCSQSECLVVVCARPATVTSPLAAMTKDVINKIAKSER